MLRNFLKSVSWDIYIYIYRFPKPADVGGGFNMFPMTGDCRFQRAAEGTVLWKPGDPADFAFLLVTGHVGVSWQLNGQSLHPNVEYAR